MRLPINIFRKQNNSTVLLSIRWTIIFIITFFTIISINQSYAEVNITVSEGTIKPYPLGIELSGQINSEFKYTIINNLKESELIKIIENTKTNNIDWKSLGASAVLIAHAHINDGQLIVDYKIKETIKNSYLLNKNIRGNINNNRNIAHKIAERVYEALTGNKGYFLSKISFVHESGSRKRRHKRIVIMDIDGKNGHFISPSNTNAITPVFNPNIKTHQIAYVDINNGSPQIYITNLKSGKRKMIKIGNYVSYAPAFHPSGNKLAMSISKKGYSEIAEINLTNNYQKILTNFKAISTSPSYSPDGTKIVFESDKSGKPSLYILDLQNNSLKKITSGNGSYSAPDWSPDGLKITFVKQYKGAFYIGIINTNGTNERMIVKGFLNEGPNWGPDSDRIIFFGQGAKDKGTKLFTISLITGTIKEISTKGFGSDPDWSANLY